MQLGVDERTIRRRITAIREIVTGRLVSDEAQNVPQTELPIESIHLPNISYRQLY